MSNYAWTITRDLIADKDAPEGTNANAKGIVGPRDCELTSEQIRRHPDAEKFIMKDDSGESYYHGYYVELGETEEGEFYPLDDFGMPNAGCSEIWYKNKNGEWSVL